MSEMLGEAGFPYRDGETVAFHTGRVQKAFNGISHDSEKVADAIIDILLDNNSEKSAALIREIYEGLSSEEQAILMAKYDGSEASNGWESIGDEKSSEVTDPPTENQKRQRRSMAQTALSPPIDVSYGRWQDRAACLGMDTEEFYGYSVSQEAKKACGRCSVSSECLSEAIKNKETGYWGGTTENYRNKRLQPRQAK